MKKLISLAMVLMFILSLIGCGKHNDSTKESNDSIPNRWGIKLETKNVTNKGLTIVCNHSGGEDVFELNTGSYYTIQKMKNGAWVDVEYLPHEYDIGWTDEAWIIEKESTTTWDVDWEWLYGELPSGKYRIGKEIMNFRGTGDYDIEIVYAEFELDKEI